MRLGFVGTYVLPWHEHIMFRGLGSFIQDRVQHYARIERVMLLADDVVAGAALDVVPTDVDRPEQRPEFTDRARRGQQLARTSKAEPGSGLVVQVSHLDCRICAEVRKGEFVYPAFQIVPGGANTNGFGDAGMGWRGFAEEIRETVVGCIENQRYFCGCVRRPLGGMPEHLLRSPAFLRSAAGWGGEVGVQVYPVHDEPSEESREPPLTPAAHAV